MTLTATRFHNALHNDIGVTPTAMRKQRLQAFGRRHNFDRENQHRSSWLKSTINLSTNTIIVDAYLQIRQKGFTATNNGRTMNMFQQAIATKWGRNIHVGGEGFNVTMRVHHRVGSPKALLRNYTTQFPGVFGRGHNPGEKKEHNLLQVPYLANWHWKGPPVSAATSQQIDDNFRHTSAHEFGHYILTQSVNLFASAQHKHTSTQPGFLKKSTPTYPTSCSMELMRYYRGGIDPSREWSCASVTENDMKRMLWLCRSNI